MFASILVVDDDSLVRSFMVETLKRQGYAVAEADSGESAIEQLTENEFDLVITDLKMNRASGMDVLRESLKIQPECRVIVVTAFGTVESAVEAMKIGASDFISKPFTADELELLVRNVLELKRLREENRRLHNELGRKYSFDNLIGSSPAMKRVFDLIKSVAATSSTVLITGETGTGKELVARAIHYNSNRAGRSFVKMNCAALPEGLIESELFGHEKGSFTGAIRTTRGRFEQANGGTLLLDEISEISPRIQAKLLRVIQEREIERLGSGQTISLDVRLIATSNRDLKAMVAKGRFRDDLYYRLQVIPINLPPLRERLEDIPQLCKHFIEKYCQREGIPPKTMSEKAMELFMAYSWPGNVREIENYIERAIVTSDSQELKPADFPAELRAGGLADNRNPETAGRTIADMERNLILKTLEANNWNKARAAEILGITSRTLRNKLAEYRSEEENK